MFLDDDLELLVPGKRFDQGIELFFRVELLGNQEIEMRTAFGLAAAVEILVLVEGPLFEIDLALVLVADVDEFLYVAADQEGFLYVEPLLLERIGCSRGRPHIDQAEQQEQVDHRKPAEAAAAGLAVTLLAPVLRAERPFVLVFHYA